MLALAALQQVEDQPFPQGLLREQLQPLHHQDILAAESHEEIPHDDAVNPSQARPGRQQRRIGYPEHEDIGYRIDGRRTRKIRQDGRRTAKQRAALQPVPHALIAETVFRNDQGFPLREDANPFVLLIRLQDPRSPLISLHHRTDRLDEILHLIRLQSLKERKLLQAKIITSHVLPSNYSNRCICLYYIIQTDK